MKKLLALVLSLVMMLSATAFAAGIPSKTTDALIDVKEIVSDNGTELPPTFKLEVTETTEVAEKELGDITKAIEGGKTVYEYFTQDIAIEAQIIDKLPLGVDPTKLEMNEFAPLSVFSYDSTIGDLKATMTFATQYKPGQAIVAMVGVDSDGDGVVEWYPLAAEVTDSNDVVITYTQDVLEKINGKEAVLAILSAPEA